MLQVAGQYSVRQSSNCILKCWCMWSLHHWKMVTCHYCFCSC